MERGGGSKTPQKGGGGKNQNWGRKFEPIDVSKVEKNEEPHQKKSALGKQKTE